MVDVQFHKGMHDIRTVQVTEFIQAHAGNVEQETVSLTLGLSTAQRKRLTLAGEGAYGRIVSSARKGICVLSQSL